MKTVTATDAKTNFGDLLASLGTGPFQITKNGRVVAELRAPESQDKPAVTDQAHVEQLIRGYASGAISRRALREQTGLAFGEVLEALGKLNLKLPEVDTSTRYSPAQRKLASRLFRPK